MTETIRTKLGQKQAPFSERSAIGADVPGKHFRHSRLRGSQAAIYRYQLSTASASSGTPKSKGTPVSSTSEWVRKDSDVALRAGLVGCARTGCAVSPLTGSIPDAREPGATAPLRVERGGRGPAGRSGKTSGNEIGGTASSSDATATSSAKSSLFRARAARAASRAPMLTADGEGQLDGSLAATLFGIRGLRVEVGRCAAPE